jgi:hypothetical protein
LGGETAVAMSRGLQGSPGLPFERPETVGELRARLVDLRAELVALRKVLRDVTG